MVCLGLEPEAAGWKAQTNPLSYGGTQWLKIFLISANRRLLFYVQKASTLITRPNR